MAESSPHKYKSPQEVPRYLLPTLANQDSLYGISAILSIRETIDSAL